MDPGLPPHQGSLPLAREGSGEATGCSFQTPEMQFLTPEKVTSPAARPGAGEGAAGGGGATPRAQRGPGRRAPRP